MQMFSFILNYSNHNENKVTEKGYNCCNLCDSIKYSYYLQLRLGCCIIFSRKHDISHFFVN